MLLAYSCVIFTSNGRFVLGFMIKVLIFIANGLGSEKRWLLVYKMAILDDNHANGGYI